MKSCASCKVGAIFSVSSNEYLLTTTNVPLFLETETPNLIKLFLIEFKLEQISYILNADLQQILFGFAVLENDVITSGDFGYLTMVAGIGLIPALIF